MTITCFNKQVVLADGTENKVSCLMLVYGSDAVINSRRQAVQKFALRLLEALINDDICRFEYSVLEKSTNSPYVAVKFETGNTQRVSLTFSEIAAFALNCMKEKFASKISKGNLKRVLKELQQSCENEELCAAYKSHIWLPWVQKFIKAQSKSSFWELLGSLEWDEQLILTEQFASLNSHPFHPMAKLKLPLTRDEILCYSPEYGNSVYIMLAAIKREYLKVSVSEKLTPKWDFYEYMHNIFPREISSWQATLHSLGFVSEQFLPVPIHPANLFKIRKLYCEAIQSKDIVLLPEVTVETKPLMSFRTMIPYKTKENERKFPPHIKLPVALQITSELRYLSPVEANDGPVLTDLLRKLLTRHEHFSSSLYVLEENIGIHYNYDADLRYTYENARYLSCLFRTAPYELLEDCYADKSSILLPLAALLTSTSEDYLDEEKLLLFEVICQYRRQHGSVTDWFQEYTSLILNGMFQLFLLYGIALEAHQQNLLLLISRSGKVLKLLVRDLQIVCREKVLDLHKLVPTLHKREDSMLNEHEKHFPINYFFHTTFVSNLFCLGMRISRKYSIPQKVIMRMIGSTVMEQLSSAQKVALELLPENLMQEWYPHLKETSEAILGPTYYHKCLLKMRCVGNKYETYTERRNPLGGIVL